jgi:glucose/arabinose dehydrogenase
VIDRCWATVPAALSRCLQTLCVLLLVAVAPSPAPGAQAEGSTEDVVLPAGYTITPVVTGLTFPTTMAVGSDGSLYIAEAGYSYGQRWAESQIWKLRPDGRIFRIAAGFRGPIMGLTLRENQLYVAHRGTVSIVDLTTTDRSRRIRDVITGLPLPPNSGHFNSRVAFGPDGKMYLAVGTPTNSGVPDATDALFGWVVDFPWMRDVPARDVTLRGSNYPVLNVLGPNPLARVRGGAFLPFGTPAREGQVIPAHRMPTGAVYRANPDGSGLEVYAWGIRSPFGLAFGPDGRLYMTNHGMDDRGARPAANAPDELLAIRQNAWYGWPDYVAGVPITDERFAPKAPTGRRPRLVMRDHPEVEQPLMRFEPHAAVTGFDWSPGDRFGFQGELFMAEFGSGTPLTTGLRSSPPAGFRVSRVNPAAGTTEPFMTVRNAGQETTRGPKHPIDVRFDPSGESLYLVDFGVMTARLSANQVGINPLPATGAVWRIRRADAAPAGGSQPAVRVRGGRPLSWWTARIMLLGIQQDMRLAVAHARAAWATSSGLRRYYHDQEAKTLIDSAGTRARLALKRIDEPDVIDDGTWTLLARVSDWADRPRFSALIIDADDPVIQAVNQWVERTRFPETDYLRQNYALPGRWQRPPEKDVRP